MKGFHTSRTDGFDEIYESGSALTTCQLGAAFDPRVPTASTNPQLPTTGHLATAGGEKRSDSPNLVGPLPGTHKSILVPMSIYVIMSRQALS